MEIFLKSLALSLVMSISCKVFFDTLLEKRRWRRGWIENTELLAFTLGIIIISMSEIPPYAIQPIRFTAVICIAVQIYYRVRFVQNVFLSILFCGIFWIVEILTISFIYLLPITGISIQIVEESVSDILLLCLMLLFHFKYKGKTNVMSGTKWTRFLFFPVFCMVIIIAATMYPWNGQEGNEYVRVLVLAGFGLVNMAAFYFLWDILVREAEMQNLRLGRERTQNQMNMYQSMQENYERQRRFLHDYKNQLNCIQGMLAEGKTEETMEYLTALNGSIRMNADHVNTNHTAVNVVLNQKYSYAREKGITMTISVNDLSPLTMSEEDIVTILVNLLDNAIEACEKLESNKVIQFKMTVEDGELILSIRNPVKEPVKIRGNRITTTKPEEGHGIGLINVQSVVQKNCGTSILRCEDGWFFFSAMIPV